MNLEQNTAPPVRATELRFDLDRLQSELKTLLSRHPFHPHAMQISLTHSELARTEEEKIYDGVGSLWDREKKIYLRSEAEFCIFNESLKDTYFYEVYLKICDWSPYAIGRVRLMLRPPGSCYRMHWDDDIRFHLALITNEHSYFLYKTGEIFQIPANGVLYIFDARTTHTGFNAGFSDRIHLVFDTIPKS